MVTVRRFCAITLSLACAVHALQARANIPVTGYVAVMNNYASRGLAQSVGNPSLQLDLDYNNTGAGFYTGIDATTIDSSPAGISRLRWKRISDAAIDTRQGVRDCNASSCEDCRQS